MVGLLFAAASGLSIEMLPGMDAGGGAPPEPPAPSDQTAGSINIVENQRNMNIIPGIAHQEKPKMEVPSPPQIMMMPMPQ